MKNFLFKNWKVKTIISLIGIGGSTWISDVWIGEGPAISLSPRIYNLIKIFNFGDDLSLVLASVLSAFLILSIFFMLSYFILSLAEKTPEILSKILSKTK